METIFTITLVTIFLTSIAQTIKDKIAIRKMKSEIRPKKRTRHEFKQSKFEFYNWINNNIK